MKVVKGGIFPARPLALFPGGKSHLRPPSQEEEEAPDPQPGFVTFGAVAPLFIPLLMVIARWVFST